MKIGILGFAHGHVMVFGDVWKNNPDMGAELFAAWDHDSERLKTCAEKLNISKLYASPDELLEQYEIEAVVITSETKFHAELVVKAAEKKKKIILYKPMSLTLKQADEIVEAVNKNSVDFTMGWQMRTDPQNIKIRELMQSGELGKLFMLRRRHCLETHKWPDFNKLWHVDPEMNRDIWADDSAHVIDFIYWMLGKPETVTAEISSIHDPLVPNDNGIAIFKYNDGVIAEAFCSFTCHAAESTTELYFENGTILQYYGDGPSTAHPRPTGQPGLKWKIHGTPDWIESEIPSPASHGERLAWQAKEFADFLHGKRPPIATAEEGRESLKMVLATYLSNETGHRVSPDDERLYDI